jgi:hypothetical protein
MIRSTLYGHFVAGTDQNELKPIVERLHKHGVKLILDYCMESDIASNTQFVIPKENIVYFLFCLFREKIDSNSNEKIYNENLLKSIKNVQTAAELCGSSAITAIKITAFISPDILQKLNQIIEQTPSTELSILELISNTSTVNDV